LATTLRTKQGDIVTKEELQRFLAKSDIEKRLRMTFPNLQQFIHNAFKEGKEEKVFDLLINSEMIKDKKIMRPV